MKVFPKSPKESATLIGMIGLAPLPGTPLYKGSVQAIVDRALSDMELYAHYKVDGVLLENSGDLPYLKPPLGDAVITVVQQIAKEVRARFPGPVGLQLLEGANLQAMEIAAAENLDFIRVEGFVFAHVGGAGIIEGCAGELLRLRKSLGADSIQVFADVDKKHCAHAITDDLSIEDVARQSEFFLADGLILTGPHTGFPPYKDDLERVRSITHIPVLSGSGMTSDNVSHFHGLADGFIVGSYFRKGGKYLEDIEEMRLASFVEAFASLK